MLAHTCKQHLIPANDAHLSRTNRHTKVYNRVFRWRSSTERRWASISHWELPKKKQVGSLYKRIVYSIGIPNDSHLLVLIRRFTKQTSFGYGCTDNVNWYRRPRTTQTGILQVRARAFNKYRHGRSTGMGTGVPYEQQRAFSRNFTMTRTVAGWNLHLLINIRKKDIFKTTTTLYCGSLLHAWL